MKKTLIALVSALALCLSVARSEGAKTTYYDENQRVAGKAGRDTGQTSY